ncbi:MAG: helix-turn-helix domain-containing protein, partial [Clostridia bacterium]|nr:helix-turn-helix domain-containing protein [Clostridia bacterium]
MGFEYIERIKQIKNEKKITNEELARLSGIPLGTLSKLLAGLSDSVKLSNMIAICEALECSLDYIVSGIPENTNNFTLDGNEIRLIEEYRRLDNHGKELLMLIAGKERERVSSAEHPAVVTAPVFSRETTPVVTAPIANRYKNSGAGRVTKRSIPLYDLPVSAGIGEYLDGDAAESVSITVSEATAGADFALRISGNSMEPKYHDGDVLLVQNAEGVEVG